jgi:hypothetical protein
MDESEAKLFPQCFELTQAQLLALIDLQNRRETLGTSYGSRLLCSQLPDSRTQLSENSFYLGDESVNQEVDVSNVVDGPWLASFASSTRRFHNNVSHCSLC